MRNASAVTLDSRTGAHSDPQRAGTHVAVSAGIGELLEHRRPLHEVTVPFSKQEKMDPTSSELCFCNYPKTDKSQVRPLRYDSEWPHLGTNMHTVSCQLQ